MSPLIDGFAKTWPKTLLQLEGAALLGSTLWAYHQTGQSWWTFACALLLPDLGMAGYLSNTKLGSISYNSVHTESLPLIGLCVAFASGNKLGLGLSLCWLAHIGMDRMLGYGLKYGTGFSHTHLGEIGGSKKKE